MATEHVVSQLNSFLRGELAAVETYRQALEKVRDPEARLELEDCLRSHQRRVDILRQQIVRRGGAPAEGSGAWGSFTKLVEGTATAIGQKAAISALEEGEDHGLADYRRDLSDLDADAIRLVSEELLPAQRETHSTLSALKHRLAE
jgi:hypothetical protein